MRFSLLFAVVVAAGCGSVSAEKTDANVGSDAPPANDFTLSVAPDSVTLPIASSMNVTVTVQRSPGLGPITLAASNLPSSITVTFATNPLPEGTDTTDATIAIAGGSTAGTSMISIDGTGGSKMHSATVTVTSQTITVTGKTNGNTTVRLVGKDAIQSDAQGNFTFTDVTPPYDIYTFATGAGSTPTVYYYEGLTRADPYLIAASNFFFLANVEKTGPISGTKSGTGTSGNPSVLMWSDGIPSSTTNNQLSGTSYSFTAHYFTSAFMPAASKAGTLYGLQWSAKTSGAPNVIQGYGETAGTLVAGTTPVTINLVFAAPSAAGIVGTITEPSGFPMPTITLTQQFGNASAPLWVSSPTRDASSTIPVGTNAGKSAIFATSASGARTSNYVYPGLIAATDVTFAMLLPPVQVAPVASTTNVDGTTAFVMTAPMGAYYEWNITTSSAATTKASYHLITNATTTHIPNVAELPVPSNQPFDWTVTGFGPSTSINDAATNTSFEAANPVDFAGPAHFHTTTTTRSFTSKP